MPVPKLRGEMLDVTEVMQALGVSRHTVHQLIREGHLRSIRLPGPRHLYRIRPEWVDELISKHTTGGEHAKTA